MWDKYKEKMSVQRDVNAAHKETLTRSMNTKMRGLMTEDIEVFNEDGTSYFATISIHMKNAPASRNPNRSNERYFLSLPDEVFPAGKIVKYQEHFWLIISSHNFKNVYREGYLLKANYELRWRDKNSNVRSSWGCVYHRQILEGIKENNQINIPEGGFSIILPKNSITQTMERGMSLPIEDESYRIDKKDGLSNENIFVITLTEQMVGHSDSDFTESPEEPVVQSGDILGEETITIGSEATFYVEGYDSGIVWEILKGEEFLVEIESLEDQLTIVVARDRNFISREIIIRASHADGLIKEKTIIITSMM